MSRIPSPSLSLLCSALLCSPQPLILLFYSAKNPEGSTKNIDPICRKSNNQKNPLNQTSTLTQIDFPQYQSHVRTVSIGKQLPDAVYIHKSAIGQVPKELTVLTLQMAKTFKIPANKWNIAKFSKRSFKITFLNYPRFEEYDVVQ